MDIAVRAAARPGQRRLVLLWAVMAGIAAGLVIGLAGPDGPADPGPTPNMWSASSHGSPRRAERMAARRTRLDSLRQILLTR